MSGLPSVVVTSAVRTPIGRFLGGLSSLPAPALGAVAVQGALQRAGVAPGDVEGVFFGHARQAGTGPNPARQVLIRAGIPESVTAVTINQACSSGLKAIQLAADEIRLGRAKVVVAGGMESMSRVPFLMDRMRNGYRLGNAEVVDAMYRDGFTCGVSGMIMGETAELLAQERRISRQEQDAFALDSQKKAAAAIAAGRFADEIVPVTVEGRKGPETMAADEHPRPDTTLESLGKLPPVFDPKKGTVGAGNSSGITDGGAALVLMEEQEAERRGIQPLARFVDSQVSGTDPRRMGLGPVPATRVLLERNRWRMDDFELVELNEAFAAQVLAVLQDLPMDRARLNVNGGAIALGHPIGCTGARIVVTLLHELRRRGARRGLATLCVSGGLGMSAAFERVGS
ncbi:MAG: thiolase family protein [Planctomycetota bacterium]|nr:MAG: thiolase family protein [Planctomycetota bacterium]